MSSQYGAGTTGTKGTIEGGKITWTKSSKYALYCQVSQTTNINIEGSKNSDVVFLSAEFGDKKPCVNPKANSQYTGAATSEASTVFELLKEDHGGCNLKGLNLGEDDGLSTSVDPFHTTESATVGRGRTTKDQETVNQFVAAKVKRRAKWGGSTTERILTFQSNNWEAQVGAQFFAAYTADTSNQVRLYARRRIPISCQEQRCEKFANHKTFKFTRLVKELKTHFDRVWSCLYVFVVFGWVMWCVLLIFFLVTKNMMKKSEKRPNPSKFLNLFAVALIFLFITCVFCWVLMFRSASEFSNKRNEFKALSNCIVDDSWKKVPLKLYEKTNLDSFHNWFIAWTVLTTIAMLMALGMLGFALNFFGRKYNQEQ